MSTDLPVLRTFVGGSGTDPADGVTSAVVDPCTGEGYAYAEYTRIRHVMSHLG